MRSTLGPVGPQKLQDLFTFAFRHVLEGLNQRPVAVNLLVGGRSEHVHPTLLAFGERSCPGGALTDHADQSGQVRTGASHGHLCDAVICNPNLLVSSHGKSVSHFQSFQCGQSLKYCGRCEPAPPDASASACPSSPKEALMAVSKRLRYEILRRDNHACRYCGATAPQAKLAVDHVIPQSLGGSDKPDNLVASCADCNAGKTSSMPNAEPVADVEQETFRQAAELKRAELVDHLWQGGYPPEWGHQDVERHAAEVAWNYAWAVASNGGSPNQDQYAEFAVHCAALFEIGHSIAEIVCAAAQAGARLTPHLSWGLDITDLQHAPISGEQFSRIDGVYEGWLEIWRNYEGPDPTPKEQATFRGELILAARNGESREDIQIASGMAGASHSARLNDFLYEWTTGIEAERAGGEV